MQKVITIKLDGDTAKINEVIGKLKDVGKVDDENAKKFKQHHDEHVKELHETGGIVENLKEQFEELGKGIIAAFAVEKIIEFGKECIKAFEEADQAAKDLEFTVQNLAKGTTESVAELSEQAENLSKNLGNLFTKKEIEMAQSSLLKMNLTLEQTTELMPILADVSAKAHKPLQEIAMAVGKGISEGRMSRDLTDLGIKFSNVGDMSDRFNSSLNGMKKYEGAAASSLDELSSKAKRTANDVEESSEKIGSALAPVWEETKRFFMVGISNLFDAESWKEPFMNQEERKKILRDKAAKKEYDSEKERISKLQKLEYEEIYGGGSGDTKGFGYLKKLNDQELSVRKENAESNLKEEILSQDKIIGVKKQYGELDLQREAKEIDKELERRKQRSAEIIKIEESLMSIIKQIRDVEAKADIDLTTDEYDKKIAIENEAYRKNIEMVTAQREKLKELIKTGNEEQRIVSEHELQKTYNEEYQLLQVHEKNLSDLQDKMLKDRHDKEQKALDEKLAKEKEYYLMQSEYQSELEKNEAKKQFNDKKLTQEQYNEELKRIELDHEKDKLEIIRKYGQDDLILQAKIQSDELDLQAMQQKKSIEAAKEMVEGFKEFNEAIFKSIQDNSENTIKVLDTQQQYNAKMLDVQSALAQRGLQNDLAFEEKRASQLEGQKLKEQQKLKKEKELEVFVNAVAKYVEDNPSTALGKAALLVGGMKVAEAAYAERGGIIGKGTETSQVAFYSNKTHSGGGDVLLHAKKGEAVFTEKDLYNLQLGILPSWLGTNMGVNTLPNVNINGGSFDTKGIEKRLDSLENAIINKKEVSIDFDGLNQMVVTQTENQIKKVTKYMHRK